LTKINNEAKVRRLTRLVVLGKAKVISYEDLEEAQAKRVTKEKAIAAKGKGKRGRKRKSPALDIKAEVEVEANSQEEEAGLSVLKNKMARSAIPSAGSVLREADRARTPESKVRVWLGSLDPIDSIG
jgi:hypothetical protein